MVVETAGDFYTDGATYSAHTAMADSLPACVGFDGCAVTPYKAKTLYDVFYNDGMFDNSKGTVTLVTGTGVLKTLDANGEFTTAANFGVLPTATDGSLRAAIIAVSGFSSTKAGRLNGPDGNEMDTESFLASLKATNGL